VHGITLNPLVEKGRSKPCLGGFYVIDGSQPNFCVEEFGDIQV